MELTTKTNTVILTGLDLDQLDDQEFISGLQQKIIGSILSTDTVQFIILRSLRRIVLIFDNKASAIKMHDILKNENDEFGTGFSLADYNNNVKDNYLQLPNNTRMFLISPPASPPPDFNFDQEEEEPNKLQIYTPEELKESLLRYNKELEELLKKDREMTKTRDVEDSDWTEKEIVLNDNHENANAPKIILHPIKGHNDHHLISHAIESFRTSLPSRSIFDELSDNEYDEEYDYDDDE